jgi:hypothetical protein
MPFLLSPLCHLTACCQPLAAPLSAYSFSAYSWQNPKMFLIFWEGLNVMPHSDLRSKEVAYSPIKTLQRVD